MKKLSVLCIALCVGLSTTAAFARGGMGGAHGMGSSHMSMMGGAFGTTAAAPGTNSLGTALSSDGVGHPVLDTRSTTGGSRWGGTSSACLRESGTILM